MQNVITLPGPAVVGYINPTILEQLPLKEARQLKTPKNELEAEIGHLHLGIMNSYGLPLAVSRIVVVQYTKMTIKNDRQGHSLAWHRDQYNALTAGSSVSTEFLVGDVDLEEFSSALAGLDSLGSRMARTFTRNNVNNAI